MNKERTNIYLTARQKKQLEQQSRSEGLPMAEIIRRALDVYLAWDDPTYQPLPSKPQTRMASSSRLEKDGAFLAHFLEYCGYSH